MRILILIPALLLACQAFSQQASGISLDSCYAWALDHNPLGKRIALSEEANTLSMEQIDAARLPEIYLNGNAQLQSENVKVPFELPGQEPFELPLFVTQASVDVEYSILDGGAAKAQKQLREAELLTDKQDVTTALSGLQVRINGLYFSILLRRSRIQVLQTSQRSLEARRSAVRVAVDQGAALPYEEAQLRAELLRISAQIDREQSGIQTAAAQLSHLTGREISPTANLQVPEAGPLPDRDIVEREELKKYSLQQQQILAREALITAERQPRLLAFGRAGFGYPNPLNFFDKTVSPFGLVGLKFSWRLFDWDRGNRDRELLSIQSREVAVQREIFEFELEAAEEAILENIASLEDQLVTDSRLVELEEEILSQKAVQLQEGVATSSDYIDQEARLATARIQLENHRLELLKAKVDYETEKGIR